MIARRGKPLPLLFLLLAAAVGAGLRLWQIASQVVIDDEWHAVRQLIESTPSRIVVSFGFADHSIPLTLCYWLEAATIGLSELGMRWPMLACGIATVVLLPLGVLGAASAPAVIAPTTAPSWLERRATLAVLFACLLAISPVLVIYSRVARPYAITLLLVFVAHHAFARFVAAGDRQRRRRFGALYAVAAVLGTWLHLIAGPLVVAPFVHWLLGLSPSQRTGPQQRWARRRGVIVLGALTAAGLLAVLLPPFVAGAGALAAKARSGHLSADTVLGAWHWWLGTGSTGVALALTLLAVAGLPPIVREFEVARSLCVGLVLTLALLVATRPAWIQNPLTFGRYLLPAIPLLLFAIAAGTLRVASWIATRATGAGRPLAWAMVGLPVAALAAQSPLQPLYATPNSYTTDPWFYFDFRPGRDAYGKAFDALVPISPFWATLRDAPAGSMRIAFAPFRFESTSWDAPRLEARTGQRIVPGILNRMCLDREELPQSPRFRFRNVVYLGDDDAIARQRVDLIVLQKPIAYVFEGKPGIAGEDMTECAAALAARLGAPRYDDAFVTVFAPRNTGR